MWLNEETRIAQVANINQLPGTDGFTSPLKDAVINTSSFLRVELSTLIGEKKPDPSGAWTCNLSISGMPFNQQATRIPNDKWLTWYKITFNMDVYV